MKTQVSQPAAFALAGELREARITRGVMQSELASMIDIGASTLCKFERGNSIPSDVTLALILGALRTPPDTYERMMRLVRQAREPDFVDYTGHYEHVVCTAYEQRARHVLDWTPALIPEVLQTPRYAQALHAAGLLNTDRLNRGALIRSTWRHALGDDSRAKYTFLISDAATRPDGYTEEIRRAQIHRLATLARHPQVTVRFVATQACPPGLIEPFTLYELRTGMRAVAVRHHRGAVFLTSGAAVATYQDTAQSLRRRAVDHTSPSSKPRSARPVLPSDDAPAGPSSLPLAKPTLVPKP